MNPTVGRTVHYIRPTEHGHAGKHRAAIIVNLPGGKAEDPAMPIDAGDGRVIPACELTTVDLAVFGDGRSEPTVENILNVPQDSTAKIPGTFHEPERDAPPAAQA